MGLVFRDRPTYLCLPLNQLGIDDAAGVTDVRTSCDCITARVIELPSAINGHRFGICLEFQPTVQGKNSIGEEPLSLAVDVRCYLHDGSTVAFVAKFVEIQSALPHHFDGGGAVPHDERTFR